MANDADLKDELIEQINSYVMTNMTPQHCRGFWLSAATMYEPLQGLQVIMSKVYDHDVHRVHVSDTL
ncbi:hypothetical protein P4S73_02815 [Paraglaciecola sp. Hal342]